MAKSGLMQVSYRDNKNLINLQNYADILVLEQRDTSTNGALVAIRFGGYPESVQGMSDSILGGTHKINVNDIEYSLTTQNKKYRRTHSMNGIYAEAVLTPKDETEYERVDDSETENAKVPQIVNRNCYLFCPKGDTNRLFDEIDKKTFVPLIPQFKEYLFEQLLKNGTLKQLTVIGTDEFDAWVSKLNKDDACIVTALEQGLHNGLISIPNDNNDNTAFENVNTVSQYLSSFGISIADKIKNQFTPLFDPVKENVCKEIENIDDCIFANTGYRLYDAQKAVAEAVKRRIATHQPALIVAECGSGKTKIGATAMMANHISMGKAKTINIVMCPAHVTEKWVREIEETLPNTHGVIVRDIAQLSKVYEAYLQGDSSVVVILSKERARDGYMRYPAVIWSKAKRAFLCPDCGMVIEMPVIADDGSKYMTTADGTFFQKENLKNHKCADCGSVLWAPLVSNSLRKNWHKIGGFGYVYRPHISRYRTRNKQVIEQLHCIMADTEPALVGAYRRYLISTYIKKKMQNCFDTFLCDELHEYNNDSGQGEAMAEFFSSCKHFIGMTATLVNSYATGIFYLLYRLMPRFMKLDKKDYSSLHEFAYEYGVTESTFEIEEADYNANRRTTVRKKAERVKPGVSPLIYSRFLLQSAVFLSLMDMGKDLPEYEEIPTPLSMDTEVSFEYNRIKTGIKKIMREDLKLARKIQSAYMNLLTVYPDQPYEQRPIICPFTGEELISPANIGSYSDKSEKDLKVLSLVKDKIANGENVLIYTSWVRIDSQKKLCEMLESEGISCAVLPATVKPENEKNG